MRSSITAIVDNSSVIATGTREPSNASTPSANAISVAVGTAQPRIAAASPWFNAMNSNAGTATPATAQPSGNTSWSRPASWPVNASRLISSATSRKKIAIRPSLIHSSNGLAISSSPMRTCTGRSRNAS